MPELPDIEAYLEALRPRVVGQPLLDVRILSPFVLRTYDPPLHVLLGGTVREVTRLGKRLVFEISPGAFGPEEVPAKAIDPALPTDPAMPTDRALPVDLAASFFLVIHLMIAGRLQWRPAVAEGRPSSPRGHTLASFSFPTGTLFLTEAGTKRRASLHVFRGREALSALNPGGIEVGASTPERFSEALRRENRTLKRALADPRILSGIGNAYSDEILHRARLSPLKLTQSLSEDEMVRLHEAAQATLAEWTTRLVAEARKRFPDKVTAFRPEMAVHGKFGSRCPVCGAPVQRIVYAENECDYCPACQTGGRVLADRSLSRLLKDDWPRGLPESEDET
jgi:formamidopyrimidine-DNA glycosylase